MTATDPICDIPCPALVSPRGPVGLAQRHSKDARPGGSAERGSRPSAVTTAGVSRECPRRAAHCAFVGQLPVARSLLPGFRSARTRTTGRLRKAWWSCCAAACTCWAWHLGRVDGRGRAGSRYRLLLVVRLAHFRLPSSGCPAVRVAPGPVRTCAAAIATALRRWRRARRREPHGSQRAAEVRDNRRTRPPHDGQNAGLHD